MSGASAVILSLGCGLVVVAQGCGNDRSKSELTDAGSTGGAGAGDTGGSNNEFRIGTERLLGGSGGTSRGERASGGAGGSGSSGGRPEVPAAGGAGEAGAGEAGTGEAGGGGAPPTVALDGRPCAGYTLIGSPQNNAGWTFRAFLVDMEGNDVHEWTITGFPPKMLPGGSLVGCSGVFPSSYDCVEMKQVSWDGELQWSFDDWADLGNGETAARHHHDFQRDGNPVGYYAPGSEFVAEGNTLVLAHHRTYVPEIRDSELDDDVIYEVDWSGARTGFEWHGVDHISEFGFDDAALDDIRNRNGTVLEWLHGNAISRLGPNKWYAAGHSEFHPNNILYSGRRANFIAILSGATGEVVWRIGPDFEGRPEESLGQIMGQHMPHMIPEGLPGAGNILVFDNGTGLGYGRPNVSRGWSRVVEFDPITFEIVWQYGSATGPDTFYSEILSGAQRLPNGNTLITIGMPGRLIEVTPGGEIVWEYQYEARSDGGAAGWVYRAYRIPPEWLPVGENEAHGNYASWKGLFE